MEIKLERLFENIFGKDKRNISIIYNDNEFGILRLLRTYELGQDYTLTIKGYIKKNTSCLVMILSWDGFPVGSVIITRIPGERKYTSRGGFIKNNIEIEGGKHSKMIFGDSTSMIVYENPKRIKLYKAGIEIDMMNKTIRALTDEGKKILENLIR